MNMLFAQEAVYIEYNNELYSTRIDYTTYWQRYLDHFNSVTILARTQSVDTVPEGYIRSTGNNVRYISLGYYNGLIGYYKRYRDLKKIIKGTIGNFTVYVLRVPGPIGTLLAKELKKNNDKYVAEVVGDPFEVIKFLALPFPFKLVMKYWALLNMKGVVKNAAAALYVTENALQKRYPIRQTAIQASASNVIIKDSQLLIDATIRQSNNVTIPTRILNPLKPKVKIGVVGMLYSIKSPLEIIKAAKLLIVKGLNIEIHFAGDGPLMTPIKNLALELGIQDNIKCHGSLPSGKGVFDFLDMIDLYLQFSKTEGLPRAMLEAMARGCPVISSRVGGVAELIAEDLLVEPGRIVELSNKIKYLLSDTARIQRATRENLLKVENYLDSRLATKRFNFYSEVSNILK